MRPAGTIGVILIILGAIVLILRGVSFTKDRHEVDLGPVEIKADEKGFIPPIAGIIAIGAGVVLIATASRKRA
jgi:hypothetical protein